jgi:hypothetical protein
VENTQFPITDVFGHSAYTNVPESLLQLPVIKISFCARYVPEYSEQTLADETRSQLPSRDDDPLDAVEDASRSDSFSLLHRAQLIVLTHDMRITGSTIARGVIIGRAS